MHLFRKNKKSQLVHYPLYDRFHKKERISLFSDAVFAIVLTILILELKEEKWEVRCQTAVALWHRVVHENGHKIVAYVLSYLFIANLWFGHNQLFKLFEKMDNKMIWVNSLLLLNVSFTSYPIALISKYPHFSAGIILF